MMLGLSLPAFTLLHVVISIAAIVAGLAFFAGVGWRPVRAAFLALTVLTSVTGFMFPPKPIGPPFVFGVVSLIALGIALYALYGRGLAGRWGAAFLAAALLAQWLNMVVLVVQAFQKIPALNALAPTGTEPPLLIAQAAVLGLIGWFGWTLLWRRRRVVS